MEIYTSESALLRCRKLIANHGTEASRKEEIACRLLLHMATEKIAFAARQALQSFANGDELRMMLMGVKRFTRQEPLNTTALRRELISLL
jgi:hypothetical protein